MTLTRPSASGPATPLGRRARGPWARAAVGALLAVAAGGAPAAGATVATLDGQEIHGATVVFAGDSVTVDGTRLALADCDWIALQDGAATAAATTDGESAAMGVALSDGSWLPAQGVAAAPAPAPAPAPATGAATAAPAGAGGDATPAASATGAAGATTAADATALVAAPGADGAPVMVSIECNDKPMHTVLAWLSRRSGTKILCIATNPPRVTMRLVNVPWQVAVARIADQYGLVVNRNNPVWVLLRPGDNNDPGDTPAEATEAAPAPAAPTPSIPDTVAVAGPLGTLVLPLACVAGWGEFPANAPPAGDKDQVLLAAGPLSGRVLGISNLGALRFQSALDPKPLELPLDAVQALRLSLRVRVPAGPLLAVSLDAGHGPLMLLPRPGLPLAAAPTVATGDACAGYRLTVEGGRRVYLGSLTPTSANEEGAFGTVWPHRVDHDLDGSPLNLRGTRYAHGVVAHSKATLTWDLGGAYLRLHALAGITDLVAPEGDCALAISGDGKVLFSRDSIKGTDAALPVDLDVSGVKVLEMRVDYGARYDIGDHLALADAWLLKKK
jgi:hypothetical protein